MRILAAADLHGAHETYQWLVQLVQVTGADALVLAGDLLGGLEDGSPVEEAQTLDARIILGLLDPCPCPVLYVMGNDDLIDLPESSGNFIPLHGHRWESHSYNFVGYQYSLPFMGGIFEKEEPAIAEDLKAIAGLIDERTILVTHSPAFGILDRGVLDLHAGSTSILNVIKARQPRLHIHGHIHQCVGRNGLHLNVGTYNTKRAALIDVDTLEDEVILGGLTHR